MSRPFLSVDDKILLSGHHSHDDGHATPDLDAFVMGGFDLKEKKVLDFRRFYSGGILAWADVTINDRVPHEFSRNAKVNLDRLLQQPRPTKQVLDQIEKLKLIDKDTLPGNLHPGFIPFSRLTFSRRGIPFELRIDARKIFMVYDRSRLESEISGDNSVVTTFMKSELSVIDGNYKQASEYLNQCLLQVSPEDVNFRILIKQQYYKVYLELARSAVRSNKPKIQLEMALGMSNTTSTLAEEVDAQFSLVEAYQRSGNIKSAVQCLRTLIEVYGQQELPLSYLVAKTAFHKESLSPINNTVNNIFTEAQSKPGAHYKNLLETSLEKTNKSFSLFLSSISPLPKDYFVRAGDFAIIKLNELLKTIGGYESEYRKISDIELAGDNIDLLMYNLWKHPGTAKGQEAFDRVFLLSKALPEEEKRVIWRKLDHMAKICEFKLPNDLNIFASVSIKEKAKEIDVNNGEKSYVVSNFKDGLMITLDREDDLKIQPNLMFVGVKIPKKEGFRFSVVCFDLSQSKEVWRIKEFRLKNLGQEPGFFKAYVYNDMVIVNGMYDAFAFSLEDGTERWHYKTPFNFEIMEATLSGNIFVLSSNSETIALQINTASPIGEVAWQQKEEGVVYFKPYFVNNHLISVRKNPFNITSRYRSTGSLVARNSVSELSLSESHPIINDGPQAVPAAQFNQFLGITDERYLMVYDTIKMIMLWKAPLDNVSRAVDFKMRVVINEKYIILIREELAKKVIYCYSLATGDVLWSTNPRLATSIEPIYSFQLEGDLLYGIGTHPSQGFFYVVYDCIKGTKIINKAFTEYKKKPLVNMRSSIYGNHTVLEVQDSKDFQILVLDKNSGNVIKKIEDVGDGPIGRAGCMSITIQNGFPVLFNKVKFKY